MSAPGSDPASGKTKIAYIVVAGFIFLLIAAGALTVYINRNQSITSVSNQEISPTPGTPLAEEVSEPQLVENSLSIRTQNRKSGEYLGKMAQGWFKFPSRTPGSVNFANQSDTLWDAVAKVVSIEGDVLSVDFNTEESCINELNLESVRVSKGILCGSGIFTTNGTAGFRPATWDLTISSDLLEGTLLDLEAGDLVLVRANPSTLKALQGEIEGVYSWQ